MVVVDYYLFFFWKMKLKTLSHFSKKDFMISWVNDHQFGAHDGAAIEIPAPKERKINYYSVLLLFRNLFFVKKISSKKNFFKKKKLEERKKLFKIKNNTLI